MKTQFNIWIKFENFFLLLSGSPPKLVSIFILFLILHNILLYFFLMHLYELLFLSILLYFQISICLAIIQCNQNFILSSNLKILIDFFRLSYLVLKKVLVLVYYLICYRKFLKVCQIDFGVEHS